MVREIKVFSTLTRKKIETDASTWGELQTHLRKEGVRFENMKVAIGKSKLMLEHPHAELPPNPFTLYLMPTKTKSGRYTKDQIEEMSYDEMRDIVRDLFLQDGESADNHFNNEGHYTNKKKDALQRLLIDWFFKDSFKEATGKTTDEAFEEITNVIENIVEKARENSSLVNSSAENPDFMDNLEEIVGEKTIGSFKQSVSEKINGNSSQEFITATVEVGFLEFIIEQLETFQTDKDHIANVVFQVIQMLKQATEDWSAEENEYRNLVETMYSQEEEHYEENPDDEFGYE